MIILYIIDLIKHFAQKLVILRLYHFASEQNLTVRRVDDLSPHQNYGIVFHIIRKLE